MTFIRLTADDGAAVHLRVDSIGQVTERPARSPEALDKLIGAQQARLNLVEAGFEIDDGSFGCGPNVEALRSEIDALGRERSTGVRGSNVVAPDYRNTDVRESADEVIALIDAANERTTT